MGAACECHGRDGRCDFLCHVSMVCGATFEWLIMIQPPWFVAGVIMGIPASIAGASTITGNRRLFSLVSVGYLVSLAHVSPTPEHIQAYSVADGSHVQNTQIIDAQSVLGDMGERCW